LISACAACQLNGTWFSWPFYSQQCNQKYLMRYPGPVPSNTSVPDWAYLNVTATNDTFNLSAASSLAAGTTPTDSSTSTLLTSSASTLSSTPTASTSTSTTPELTSNSTSDASQTGAIAGGTVGGLVVGLLVALWLHMRHRRSRLVAHTSPQVNERGIMSVRRSLTEPSSYPVLRPLPNESSTLSLHTPQERSDTDDISNSSPIPFAMVDHTPQSELLSGPWGPPGETPQPLGGGEIYGLGGDPTWTNSCVTWVSGE